MRTILLATFTWMCAVTFTQTFTEVSSEIIPSFFSAVDFADYDNDGDQDLALIGVMEGFIDVADIFQNDNGTFTPIEAGIAPMHMGAVSWADYDNDGDYDLLCSGQDYGMNAFAQVYENDNGTFTPAEITLPPGFWNSTGWADWDNDGDLDLAYSWYANNMANSGIFRNDDGLFVDINAGLPGLTAGSMEWADYDNDGDPDLLITGTPTDFVNTPVMLYRNEAGIFVDAEIEFMDCAWYNNALWDDVDQDGDQDVLYVGDDGTDYFLVVYFNNENDFEFVNTGLEGVRTSNGNSSMVTGDIDNDGDNDVVMTGDDPNYIHTTKIYLNDGGTYSELTHNIPGYGSGSLDLSDIDNDGDLDILLVGYDNSSSGDVGLFLNDANNNAYNTNEAPAAPEGLTAVVDADMVTLSWDASTDDHTPQESLQYNLYIGSSPNTGDVVCAQSIISTAAPAFGFHQLPKNSNCQYSLTYELSGLPDDIYYWSVQAIDQSGMASPFSPELSFNIGNVVRVEEHVPSAGLYPNPASGNLNVVNGHGGTMDIAVYDIAGMQVLQAQSQAPERRLDISSLKPGIYLVKIRTGSRQETARFIKQ
jgi:hypothetical protein